MRVDRRRFLGLGLGTIGATVLGSACSSDSELAGLVFVKRFSDTATTPGDVRLPITFASPAGQLVTKGPATIKGRIVDASGTKVADFSAPQHSRDIVNPYWPVRVSLGSPGFYRLDVNGGPRDGMNFQLLDPADVVTPSIGQELPTFDTPTVDDARGVDPVCTLTPNPCPFHAVTLTEALASGKHVVYMVGTPAHCEFGTCGPGLDFLVAASAAYGDRAVFVHAEVYTDDTATTVAPAVGAVGLEYEPVIYITDRSGVVSDRVEIIWDRPEIDQILARNIV
jgi:hypothetical protein